MSSIKAFEFAAKRAEEAKDRKVPDGPVLAGYFTIDGQKFEVQALHDTNIAWLVAKVNDEEETTKAVAAVIDFMDTAMTPESAKRFAKMALAPKPKGMKIDEVMEVFQHVLTLVAAGEDPTGSSNGSSRPRRTTGGSSTATAR